MGNFLLSFQNCKEIYVNLPNGVIRSNKFRTSEETNETYIFGKHMTRAIQKDNFYLYWTSISKVMALFGMGYYQIWSYHVTQVKNLSFSYLKSYSPLKVLRKITKFCCFTASLADVIRRQSKGGQNLQNPSMSNRVNSETRHYSAYIYVVKRIH